MCRLLFYKNKTLFSNFKKNNHFFYFANHPFLLNNLPQIHQRMDLGQFITAVGFLVTKFQYINRLMECYQQLILVM